MFSKGQQIAYIPNHAAGDITHPDVEFGFVTSATDTTVFCRFWKKNRIVLELRTTANSEGCYPENIVESHYTDQENIDRTIRIMAL